MRKLLVISDVHGRRFWKEAVAKHFDKVDKVIFLGDYVDPYIYEGITRKEAISNFQEIIDFKSENKDKVVLLLGNHDIQYIDKHNFTTRSRYDSSNAYKLEEMFHSHKSFFKLAHEEIVDGKPYLFSHSALIPKWYEDNKKVIGEELTTDAINHLLDTPHGFRILSDMSWYRGGSCDAGSIVWADVNEAYNGMNKDLPWSRQVFGHSQQSNYPIINEDFACLDCRRAFILNDEGGFQEA